MGKKCIPGVVCVENMTLFILVVIFIGLAYIGLSLVRKSNSTVVVIPPVAAAPAWLPPPVPPRLPTSAVLPPMNMSLQNTNDIFNDPYVPPVKRDEYIYRQMGILTAAAAMGSENKLILPLMGRNHINGRDKWNYYTISNTGPLNTKLPIRVKGRLCTNEYGCDQLFSGDEVFVEGYDKGFRVTVYENNSYTYMPW